MAEIACRFGEFELDRSAYQLRRKGRPVTLERIPLDLLFLLAERRGSLVTRQEILERIWGKNVFLDVDGAINTAVRKIRRALHDDAETPRFIETVPAKGYRFLGSRREARGADQVSARLRPPKTSLVAREREMATLRENLDGAASGSGRLVLISGEPGIGKTRLADELAAQARAKGMTVLSGRCLDDEQAVPFLPFVEILESIVDRAAGPDHLRTIFAEQGGELARLLPKLATMVPEFTPRTDLGPAETRRYLFNCFCDFVARTARDRSLLMLLEDLHWADESTLSLLDHVIQRLSEMPIVLVGTYRDSELDVTSGLARHLEKVLRDRLAKRIGLKRLLSDEVTGMLQTLSGQEPPAQVTETIFAESKGNPFLIEELFRHLEEEGRLYDTSGKFRERLVVGEQEAPPSVQLVVTRRLNRLRQETRRMLGMAAVIGRSFGLELLKSSSENGVDAVLGCVEEAEKSGLIYPVDDSPDLRFEFSHELVRQAVIAGLSAARRQSLHLKVAEAIERTYQGELEEHLAELAHQYRRGGNHAAATEFLRRAGEQAVGRAMYSEAEAYFADALREVMQMPASPERDPRELRVCSSYATAMAATRGYSAFEVVDIAKRSHALAEKTDDLAQLVQSLWIETAFPETRGDLGAAAKLIDEMLIAAERDGSQSSLAMAYTSRVENRFYRGDFSGAEEDFHRGRAFFEAPGFASIQYGPVAAFGEASWNAWIIGRPDVARQRMQQALERTQRNPYDGAVLSQMRAVLHEYLGEFAEAEAVAAKALAHSEERGFVELAIWHRIPLGVAVARLGRAAEGVAMLKEVVRRMVRNGQRTTLTHTLTYLAQAQALDGSIGDALKTLEDAFEASDEELYFRPETIRVRGELRMRQGDRSKPEADFHEAIAMAQKMSAKSWELRSTTSLARLLKNTGRRAEAYAALVEIYGWFTEGFDTLDLKEAKSLIEELGA